MANRALPLHLFAPGAPDSNAFRRWLLQMKTDLDSDDQSDDSHHYYQHHDCPEPVPMLTFRQSSFPAFQLSS